MPDLTVAENLFLGASHARDWVWSIESECSVRRGRCWPISASPGSTLAPSCAICSLSDRQLIEIAKALRRRPRVLILDEATSALNRGQVEQVFAVVRRLRDEGVAVVFISHRMDEVRALCDRATIFRDGVAVGTVAVDQRAMMRSCG